jgi:hypothetical protein
MQMVGFRQIVAGLMLVMTGSAALAAVPHDQANFDAAKMEPFRRKNQKYTSVEQEGKTPGPWALGSWAEGAVSEAALVADAGDGKPAIRMMNVSGQASAMFKPWTDISLERGTWEARAEYRKVGKSSGKLVVNGPDKKDISVDLSPTGAVFKTAVLTLEIVKDSDVRATFQLYGGIGAEEALYIRSFNLVRVGDVSADTKTAEQQANVRTRRRSEGRRAA